MKLNVRWAVALAALALAVGATSAVATTMVTAPPKYPAACKKVVACVDNHLNNLDARIHAQHLVIVNMQSEIQSMQNQLGCYSTTNFAQYPHASATSSGDTAPGSGGTWLDLERPDNPANNTVYSLVRNFC